MILNRKVWLVNDGEITDSSRNYSDTGTFMDCKYDSQAKTGVEICTCLDGCNYFNVACGYFSTNSQPYFLFIWNCYPGKYLIYIRIYICLGFAVHLNGDCFQTIG